MIGKQFLVKKVNLIYMNITPLECLLFSELGGSICCRTMERSPLSLFICLIYPPLNMKGESSMSEAIITRRSRMDSGPGTLITNTITSNTTWTVPNHKGDISVRIFGGGGGGDHFMGGGGGWMNNADLTIANGEAVRITIGRGGLANTSAGGTSSFGSYLSANGGTLNSYINRNWYAGSGGSGGGGEYGGIGYQFGGGGGIYGGGNGGIWGGGGGCGGYEGNAGNGGTYGGGGGGYNKGGRGGTYGGNGASGSNSAGYVKTKAENGTNTIGNNSVPNNCQGPGTTPGTNWSGGGGFGGRGGGSVYGGGGGGGYGGNGGWGVRTMANTEGGGGGGYGHGADGGNLLGGGGGYFARGGSGSYTQSSARGGGGGSYGRGGNVGESGQFGGGGGGQDPDSDTVGSGGDGICIIQYYA